PGVPYDPVALARLIGERRVSHLLCVPSLYGLLLSDASAERLAGLKVAIVAGEACRGELVARHCSALPHVDLINEYGPTEATVWCTAHRCGPAGTGDGNGTGASVAIGRPVPNTRIYVLDSQLEPVPIGVTGELYVGGLGVARG